MKGAMSCQLLLVMLLAGCRPPIFTLPDTGKTLEGGKASFIPLYSQVRYKGDTGTGVDTHNLGCQFSLGFGRFPLIGVPLEGAMRLEFALSEDSDQGDTVYLKGQVKTGIARNIAFLWGNQIHIGQDTFEWNFLETGLIGCLDLSPRVSADVYALTALCVDDDRSSPFVTALGVSLNLRPSEGPFAIKPIVGCLMDAGGDLDRWSMGIGLVFR